MLFLGVVMDVTVVLVVLVVVLVKGIVLVVEGVLAVGVWLDVKMGLLLKFRWLWKLCRCLKFF